MQSNLACGYARYSPRPSIEDVESINVQLAANERYASMAGLSIVETFKDEEVSARKTTLDKRDGGKAMIEFIAKHKIRHVVVMTVARIFRNTEDGLRWKRKLAKLGVTLHFSNEGGVSLNASTAMGEAMFTLALMMATFEPKQTAERTSQGMKHRQKHGRLMSGRAPFGTKRGPDQVTVDASGKETRIRTLVKDASEEQLGRRIVELGQSNHGQRQIARILMDDGFRFRGGKIHHTLVRKVLAQSSSHSSSSS